MDYETRMEMQIMNDAAMRKLDEVEYELLDKIRQDAEYETKEGMISRKLEEERINHIFNEFMNDHKEPTPEQKAWAEAEGKRISEMEALNDIPF